MTFPEIRLLRSSELDRMSELLGEVFHRPGVDPRRFTSAVRRHFAIQPDGWFVAEIDGAMVGGAAVMDYGSFAYIGPTAVRSAHRRQRVGTILMSRLLRWLDDRAVPAAVLDATEDGAPLYEQLGFVDTGESYDYYVNPPRPTGKLEPSVRLCGADFDAIVRLDAQWFGEPRAGLLKDLSDDDPSRVLAAFDMNGRVSGYAFAQAGVIGPVGAESVAVAEALLDSALALPYLGPVRVLVPGANVAATQVLAARGFRPSRALRHMRRGSRDIESGNWKYLYGKASLAWG